MQTLPLPAGTNPWLLRLLTLLLAALAAASASFWVLKWPSQTDPATSPLPAQPALSIDSSKVAQLLGASQNTSNEPAAPAAPVPTNFQLLGIIAQGGPGTKGTRGSALISVEGTLAKPYRVGDLVTDGLVLQSVQSRAAHLAASMAAPVRVTLELPELSPP